MEPVPSATFMLTAIGRGGRCIKLSPRSQSSTAASESVSCLQQQIELSTLDADTPSCWMTVLEIRTTLDVVGRCENGSDETLNSKELAEKAAFNGTERQEVTKTFHVKVDLS